MMRAAALAVLALACSVAAASGMTKQEYNAAKAPIAAAYLAERQKCGVRHGNAADICIARATGARDVSKAELEAAYKPSPRTYRVAALARARSTYLTAKEECDGQARYARKRCMDAAKGSMGRATADAISATGASS